MVLQRTGDEHIVFDGMPTGYLLSDFWRWSFSDLLNNTLRGAYAEFIVSAALDLNMDTVNEDWTPWDVTFPHQWTDHAGCSRTEARIEVKSGSYVQSWAQAKPSNIVFSIRQTRAWDSISGYQDEVRRQSDLYVFCLYSVQDREQADPLTLDGWTFYIIPTSTLDDVCGAQKTLSLPSLLKLNPVQTDFSGVKDAVLSFLDA